ncbi:MAG: TonB-dependent receptor [Opitutae bacterium]|nr:TonB-dependent receptor [Opitutae bacterium]
MKTTMSSGHAVLLRRAFCGWIFAVIVATMPSFNPRLAAAESAGGTIVGTVAETGTGKLLEGAEIFIEGTDLRTNAEREGRFSLSAVPSGMLRVTISYPGLEPKTIPVTVKTGEPTDLATIRLSAAEILVMEAINVQGAKEGMAQAVALQKVSFQSKVVAASDQFGPVSEGNVGEYLKFLPGVSIDYNVNDARGVSLRGLSTAFTIVAVDGTPMAGGSSTDDTRRFEFEQIAMNNVETTELYKSMSPDIPAGATGGFVNFVTKSAFDVADQQRITYDLSLSAPSTNFAFTKQGGVWGHRKEYTARPSLDLNVSRKINSKLGLNINYRLSEKYDDSPRTEFTWATAATAPTVMQTPRLQQYNVRSEQKLTHREAFATKIDYRFNDRTKLMIAGQWNWYDLNFTQRGPQFVLGTAATRSGTDDIYTSGATGASIQNGVLYRNKFGTTMHVNGTFSHEFANRSRLTITPYSSRADAKYRDTNKGYISSVTSMAPGAATYSSFTLTRPSALGVLPSFTLNQGAATVPFDLVRTLSNYTLSNTATGSNFQSRNWTAIDKKQGVRGDYFIDPELGVSLTLQTGFAFDTTRRDISRPDLRGVVAATTGAALAALQDPLYTRDVALGFGSIQVVDPFKVWEANKSATMNLNIMDSRAIEEENQAGYIRADWKAKKDLLVFGGVRFEKRTIDATARTGAPARARLTEANLKYDAWYPSVSFKYTPKRQFVFRGGYSRTVGHPDYGEVLPSFITPATPTGSDGTISVPTSTLKPYFTNNYDLSADYYLKNSGVISLAVYRKDVSDFIISRSMTAAERTQYLTEYGLNPADFGATVGTLRENGSKSRLQGFEASYAQALTFLPKPFNGLNIQANFTYTDIDTFDADPFRAIDTLYSQLRAVSPKTINFIIGYRYGRFNTTITNNWVSDALYGGFVNTNYFTGTANTANTALDTRLTLNKDEKFTTDIKVEWSFTKSVSAYFLVRNVLNTARKEYLQGYLPENRKVVLPYRYFEFGEPHLTVGVRGRF